MIQGWFRHFWDVIECVDITPTTHFWRVAKLCTLMSLFFRLIASGYDSKDVSFCSHLTGLIMLIWAFLIFYCVWHCCTLEYMLGTFYQMLCNIWWDYLHKPTLLESIEASNCSLRNAMIELDYIHAAFKMCPKCNLIERSTFQKNTQALF